MFCIPLNSILLILYTFVPSSIDGVFIFGISSENDDVEKINREASIKLAPVDFIVKLPLSLFSFLFFSLLYLLCHLS